MFEELVRSRSFDQNSIYIETPKIDTIQYLLKQKKAEKKIQVKIEEVNEVNGVSNNSKYIKKKRLKGNDLINSIKVDPMYSGHDELLDKRMDDTTRKRMMIKIRNRVSAQESRDRKKDHIDNLESENLDLLMKNQNLLEYIRKLEAEKAELLNKNNSNNASTQNSTDHKSPSQTSLAKSKSEDQKSLGSISRKSSKSSFDLKIGGGFGALFVVCLLCVSAFVPQNGIQDSQMSGVKTNAMMPLLNSNFSFMGVKNPNALAKIEDICKGYCFDKCKESEREYYEKNYKIARN